MPIERAFAATILGTMLAALSGCGGAGPQGAPATSLLAESHSSPAAFTFQTVDDPTDPAFNEILGINDQGKLSGFFGSGSTSDPSNGDIVVAPYGPNNFRNQDYPGAVDTVLAGLNKNTFVGYYRDSSSDVCGLVFADGIYTSYKHPGGLPKGQSVTELLGENNSEIAVGFYTDSHGVNQAFTLNIVTDKYHVLKPPGGKNAVATSISSRGDIVGYLERHGRFIGFLLRQGSYTEFTYPRSTGTKFLGVTIFDEIVGSYVDRAGATHGFILTDPLKPSLNWQRVDEPDAAGTTAITGINQIGDIVGYYVDSGGVTNGFFAAPASPR